MADEMPDAYKVIELGENFEGDGKVWDVPTQTFVHWETPEEYGARMIIEIRAAAEAAATVILAMPGVSKLTLAQRAALKDKLLFYLIPTAKVN
ncbi:MAG: hypothetical protein MUO35_03800 [Anaerolineales bacterium]|nr:hypothetical protein [Anaerolineales bacterium]